MSKLPFRNLMLWLTILTLLWSSQGQGYGYVWCVTEDGQTQLESVLESHCGEDSHHTADSADRHESTFAAEDNSCGSCLDLAATHDTLQHRTLSGGDADAPFLPTTNIRPSWASPALVRQLDNNLILETTPRVTTTLLAHRTIVLLI